MPFSLGLGPEAKVGTGIVFMPPECSPKAAMESLRHLATQ